MLRFLPLFLILAACSGTALRYSVPVPEITETVSIRYGTVEVRDVSLPSYAAAEEIQIQRADGALVSSADVLWADAPEREVSLALSRNLAALTNARVANEPWPFDGFPDARVEVRIEDMLAVESGAFRLTGQYFVAPTSGRGDRSDYFSIVMPYDPEGGIAAIGAARAAALLQLSETIARDGLR